MIDTTLVVVITILVVLPIVLLTHNLGHAIPTILLTPRRVALRVGAGGMGPVAWRMGRVDLHLGLLSYRGSAWPDGAVPRIPAMIAAIGGPLASLFSVMTFATLSSNTAGMPWTVTEPLRWGIVFSLVGLVQSALPVGTGSDGPGPARGSDMYWFIQYLRHPEWLTLYPPA